MTNAASATGWKAPMLLVIPSLGLLLGCTPSPAELDAAVARGDAVEVGRLLDAGASPGVRESDGPNRSPPLLVAIQDHHPDVVKVLLDHGAQHTGLRRSPLVAAAAAGEAEAVAALLAAGAPPDGDGDESPVREAVSEGHLAVLDLLLAAGAKADVVSADHEPPIVLAVHPADKPSATGDVEVIRRLLDAGVPIDRAGVLGTALQRAVWYERLDVATLLVQRGADPLACIRGTFSAAYLANSMHSAPLCDLFLAAGVRDFRAQKPIFPEGVPAGVPVVVAEGGSPVGTYCMDRLKAE